MSNNFGKCKLGKEYVLDYGEAEDTYILCHRGSYSSPPFTNVIYLNDGTMLKPIISYYGPTFRQHIVPLTAQEMLDECYINK